MNREEQFAIIRKARNEIMEWAGSQKIRLFRVEYVVPFVKDDFSLTTWFFFKTNQDVADNAQDGTSDRLSQHFLEILQSMDYPAPNIKQVSFIFDSDENVQKNYEGSYFYRLR